MLENHVPVSRNGAILRVTRLEVLDMRQGDLGAKTPSALCAVLRSANAFELRYRSFPSGLFPCFRYVSKTGQYP
jgi:hypothetical protein